MVEAGAAKVAEYLGIIIHHVLCISKVYPSELFAATACGSFMYRRSRHPELNAYIDRICASIKTLILNNSFRSLLIRVEEAAMPLAEWVVEGKLAESPLLQDWIGSIVTKMSSLATNIRPIRNPVEVGFSIRMQLNHGLSMYKLCGGDDWILADSENDYEATIFPCKSFFNHHCSVFAINSTRYTNHALYNLDQLLFKCFQSNLDD